MHRLITLVTVLLLLPVIAWSQKDVEIVPGSRIRITQRGTDKSDALAGTVITMRADSVVMRLDNSTQRSSFALAGLARFEVSWGKTGHSTAGMGIGALAGAGIGALLGAASTDNGDHLEKLGGLLIGGGIGAGVGLLVGGMIGASYKTEKWVEVEVESISVSAGASRDGGVALTIGFHF